MSTPIPVSEPDHSLFDVIERAGLTLLDETDYLVECPGIQRHTKPNAPKDCRVWPNEDTGTPRIFCFHTSCTQECEEANVRLLRAARDLGWTASESYGSDQASVPQQAATQIDPQAVAQLKANVLKHCPDAVRSLKADPKNCVQDLPHKQWHYLLVMFPDDAIIWTGRDKYDTGSPGHVWRFQTPEAWIGRGSSPGAYICPNSFTPGVVSRCENNIAQTHFLVVEADDLSHDEQASIFRWMESLDPALALRAVVDTGGKSLHGWFNYPPPDLLEDLKELLPLIGCDPAMFKRSQPCRLPGVIRPETGRWQQLIYFRNDYGR